MKLKVIVHHDPDGLWGEVPAIPGCVSQADTMTELMANLREAIEGCLAVDIGETPASADVIEIAV
jgi:predicted RNase H-like HicB family nuclease